MIRRDYILRMIEEFFQLIARARALRAGEQWSGAWTVLEEGFRKLTGSDSEALLGQTDTEVLASLIRGDSFVGVREKALLLATLLKEAADLAKARGDASRERLLYLKGLHLLLQMPEASEVGDVPEFMVKVETFVQEIGEDALPLPTLAMLMRHYETGGNYAKAEDMLFAMAALPEKDPGLLEFGNSFFQRLLSKTDLLLEQGNLPRTEVETGLVEWQKAARR